MSIQDLGAIGEFLGSLFVLVTLVYLAVQVRHSKGLLEENRTLALSAAYQARTGFRMELAKDSMNDDFVAIQEKLRGGHSSVPMSQEIENFERLTAREKIKLMLWQEAVSHSIDNALFQNELGLADHFVAATAEEILLEQYPFWQHTGILIPKRVQAWYEAHQPDD